MQYTVTRVPGGQLLGDMLVVLDVTGGRDALVRSIGQVETETQYLLEPQASGTRLTLANRYFRPVPEARQNLLRDSTVEFAGRYKTLIEESGGQRRRCPRPRHDQAKGLRRRMSVPGGAAAAPLMSKATARTRWAMSLYGHRGAVPGRKVLPLRGLHPISMPVTSSLHMSPVR
jgi:hypothetical protein